jgi:hypothetical protein
MTPHVCANVSRYRTSEPESAASVNQLPSSATSLVGRSRYPLASASSTTVAGRRPPSR